MPKKTPLSLWLKSVLVDWKKIDLNTWCFFTGITSVDVHNWIDGKTAPSPADLDKIVSRLEDYHDEAETADLLAAWKKMAVLPINVTAGIDRISTLDDYRTSAYVDKLVARLRPNGAVLNRAIRNNIRIFLRTLDP